MNPTHQLALNSASTYFRTIVTICLTLLGSRWVLNALGQSDFGLFNLVGSIIVFVTFLNSVMASSVARHFAYSMGRGNKKELIRWFNTALCAHLCLGVLLLLIGWPIGEYTIRNFLNVPAERLLACLWVFRISLISAFINMVSVPFVGMYTAQQRIYEIAFWGVFQSFLIPLYRGRYLVFREIVCCFTHLEWCSSYVCSDDSDLSILSSF
jgi:O-antigen/teichoic acid export membrane protein